MASASFLANFGYPHALWVASNRLVHSRMVASFFSRVPKHEDRSVTMLNWNRTVRGPVAAAASSRRRKTETCPALSSRSPLG